MKKFRSTKVYDGFSACFRQYKATDTRCRFVHGYSISFKIIFEGELDERNWVWDFGGMKRSKELIDGKTPNDWLSFMFDHTTIIAGDDPELDWFIEADKRGILQLRILPFVGAERFAEFVFDKINDFVIRETKGRVKVVSVECKEHEKNSAIYLEN
jgi:6-pyruvoyltetrahydropterin/6-carboxytetrahydropterin synthase